jgi:hypothetical protein
LTARLAIGRRSKKLLRKIVAALILVPLAIVIIAFAVANRQIVTVSLDPFSSNPPAAAVTLPLFALIIVLLILGVVIGGVAAWLRQGKWRRPRGGSSASCAGCAQVGSARAGGGRRTPTSGPTRRSAQAAAAGPVTLRRLAQDKAARGM